MGLLAGARRGELARARGNRGRRLLRRADPVVLSALWSRVHVFSPGGDPRVGRLRSRSRGVARFLHGHSHFPRSTLRALKDQGNENVQRKEFELRGSTSRIAEQWSANKSYTVNSMGAAP